ncbi:MAG: zinc ribbon domain-containing protein [candidate division KSB1 bacterium]
MNASSRSSQNLGNMLALFITMLLLPLVPAFFSWPLELHGSDWVVAGFILVCWSAWILMTFYVYQDAQKRGGNAMLWALFVFFGQVLGFLVYLIMRSAAPKLIADGEKKCPQCRKPRQEDFAICPYCRAPLQAPCPNCKRIVETDWQVCPYCRHEASPVAAQALEERLQ